MTRPYRSPAREAAAGETRARIVAAARAVLSSGSRPFTIDEVARKARVARITVFDRFGSKAALFEALFDDYAWKSPLTRIPEVFAETDVELAVDRVISLFCDFWESDRRFARRLRALAAVDREVESALQRREEMRRTLLRTLLEKMRWTGLELDAAVDVLFMLTSFQTYDAMARSRSAAEVATLIQRLARACSGRPT